MFDLRPFLAGFVDVLKVTYIILKDWIFLEPIACASALFPQTNILFHRTAYFISRTAILHNNQIV